MSAGFGLRSEAGAAVDPSLSETPEGALRAQAACERLALAFSASC